MINIRPKLSESECVSVSRGQQYEVVVHVDHWHVERRDLVHAQRFVSCGVQLLYLQLPLHPLHGVQSGGLMLLPH